MFTVHTTYISFGSEVNLLKIQKHIQSDPVITNSVTTKFAYNKHKLLIPKKINTRQVKSVIK